MRRQTKYKTRKGALIGLKEMKKSYPNWKHKIKGTTLISTRSEKRQRKTKRNEFEMMFY